MAYVKSDNNREREGGKNECCAEDKWCKYPWQAVLTQCLWIQPWLREAVDPCWLSGGHLGSKHLAVWQIEFWVLLLALHAVSQCSNTAKKKKKQQHTGQNLLRLKLEVWHRHNVWSGHQRISDICLMEIHGASLPTVNFIVVNITLGYQRGRDGEKHARYNRVRRTQTQPRYNWYTHPDNLSIWLPVSLVSCFTLSHKRHRDTMTWTAAMCVHVCVFVRIHRRGKEREREIKKERRKRWGEKTEWASIAK